MFKLYRQYTKHDAACSILLCTVYWRAMFFVGGYENVSGSQVKKLKVTLQNGWNMDSQYGSCNKMEQNDSEGIGEAEDE